MTLFVCYPKCSTCQKARKWLDGRKIAYEFRDIKADRPNAGEIKAWSLMSGQPLKKFFNTSGNSYKNLGMKDRLPGMSESDMLELLAADGMLVKRPILIGVDFALIGFKEHEWETRFETEHAHECDI
ncbi:MAG: arsenate reductase family protein [Synergistaceae bacterium]|jgi:arsenate reductase|nr:arsenate reductase family protein [Synergistaceae bacterium]